MLAMYFQFKRNLIYILSTIMVVIGLFLYEWSELPNQLKGVERVTGLVHSYSCTEYNYMKGPFTLYEFEIDQSGVFSVRGDFVRCASLPNFSKMDEVRSEIYTDSEREVFQFKLNQVVIVGFSEVRRKKNAGVLIMFGLVPAILSSILFFRRRKANSTSI